MIYIISSECQTELDPLIASMETIVGSPDIKIINPLNKIGSSTSNTGRSCLHLSLNLYHWEIE